MLHPPKPGQRSPAAPLKDGRGPGAVRQANRNVRLLAAALSVTTLWAAGASWYLVFHDEVLARFVSQQSAMQYSYEERIGALRAQLDRSAIERLSTRDGVEVRLAELAQRQAAMERRQALLAALAGETERPQIDAPAADDKSAPSVASKRSLTSSKPIPTPDALELRTQDEIGSDAIGRRSARDLGTSVARLDQRLDDLAAQQARTADGIGLRAGRGAQRLRNLVARTGLDLARLERRPSTGLGGPFVSLASDPFGIAVAQAQRSIGEEERLRKITQALPLRLPIAGDVSLSSSFGARLDPFTRALAMHTGVDMKAEPGAPARATAAGRVVLAEYSGGYGNLVEIDHGHGVTTRYAHLASFAVEPGQSVDAGRIVGRVGSTGRSTGSHLHYETRIDGEPVDPQRFLRAGNGVGVVGLSGR